MPRDWRRLLNLASFSLRFSPIMLKQIARRSDVVLLIEPTFFCCHQTLYVARLSGATAWLLVQDLEVDVACEPGDFFSSVLKEFIQKRGKPSMTAASKSTIMLSNERSRRWFRAGRTTRSRYRTKAAKAPQRSIA